MVDELPVHNKLLLQHLVCVLHHILESADINKMDAYNLAVCIAPTLLQLDGTPLDEQKEKMQKVESLVMNIRSHFWYFEALWFTMQKTSKGFISRVILAQALVMSLFIQVLIKKNTLVGQSAALSSAWIISFLNVSFDFHNSLSNVQLLF